MNLGRPTLDQRESWWGDRKMYLFWYYLICDTAGVWGYQPLPSVPHPPVYLIHLNQSTSAWRGRSSSSVQTFSGEKISDVYTPDSSKNGIRGDWHWSTSKRWELSCGEKSTWFFETFRKKIIERRSFPSGSQWNVSGKPWNSWQVSRFSTQDPQTRRRKYHVMLVTDVENRILGAWGVEKTDADNRSNSQPLIQASLYNSFFGKNPDSPIIKGKISPPSGP